MTVSFETWNLLKGILEGVGIFFLIYMIGYATFLFISVTAGSVKMYTKRRRDELRNSLSKNYHIPVSIIIPAHNEEVTVTDTVKSLLGLDYITYEIIVVDDGSDDDTSGKLIDAFELKKIHRPVLKKLECKPELGVYETFAEKAPLTLVRKENGGKADALNMGINVSRYPYFICMDADSVLQSDSLTAIAASFLENENLVAAGGIVRPSNDVSLSEGKVTGYRLPRNILACMQVLEYDRTFLASRLLFDTFNGSMIISGAFGMFKKDVVIACGGYDTETVGEDMELVVRLHEFCVSNGLPYKISYVPGAVCWSQVPESFADLCRQRKRWHAGLMQSLGSHRRIFMNHKFGALSFISYLYFLFYELLSPIIELSGIVTIGLSWALGLINTGFMIEFLLVYAVYSQVLTLTTFFTRCQVAGLEVSAKDAVKAGALCFFEVSILRFLLVFVRFSAIAGYKKKNLKWGSIRRLKQEIG